LPTHDRQTNVVAECPCCGNGHRTSKLRPLEHHETRAGAAELRSRRLAKRAGESEVYENLLEDVGPFNAQQDEIERQIERDAPISAEKMDLTPIESDRYEDLAKTVLEPDRRKFEEWAEEYAGLYEDAFETEVSTDRPGDELFAEEIADDLESWASRADRDELSRGEVTLTDQQPASAAAIVDLETTTVTDLWTALFGHDDVRAALAQSLADLFGGMEPVECYDVLEEYGIPFWVRSHIVNVARGYASDSVTCDGPADPRRVVDEIIAPLPENPLAETVDLLAVASLFDGLETEPVIGVVVRDAFVDDVRRDQRVDVCDLLAVLADACSVRLVGSTVTLGKVANSHRSDLPGVSEWCNRNREVQQIDAAQRQVATALERGDFAVTMLRELSRDPNGILSYSELYSLYPGDDDSRVRQLVSEYVDLELVDRFGPRTDRKVELLPAGERVLELYETEIARQRSISDFVSGGGKQQQQGRVPTRSGVGGEAEADAVTADGTAPYRTRYMAPDEHAAAAACGQNGGVTLVRGPVADHERRTRYASYDPERGEAVAAVRAGGPLPLTTSAALALASPEFVDRALPADKLESIDDPPVIVRDARCIGGASDRALEDGQEFRETLIEWGAEIADMTTKLNHGDHDALDRAQFRSEIIRSAQGLWGTITHLLDLFGIDVHYEIRVPENTDQDDLDALAKSIGYAAAIQSTYNGHYACYRQLFEDREDKRRTAFTAQVDAADPTGSLIPSFVVRGPDVHRLEDSLRTYLESPTEVHDDAPEFGVDIPIRTDPGRDAYDAAIRRVLSRKNIRTTTEAVSTLHGLVATPHDAARVLHRRLSSEAEARDVRPDELRRALQALEPIAILPQLGSADRRTDTAGKIVQTLLAADDPLSKSELAERAGVSKKTVYNYREQLEPLGIMVVDEGGYRIGLSAPTSDGRESRTYPTAVGARFTEAVDAVLERRLPTDRYADPDDPIGGLLFWSDGDPPNPWALLDHPDYGPIARLARRLTNGQRTRPAETAVLMGPEMKQKSLEGAAVSASAD
ncbi:HTH domain-containing protein, partial [Halobiforma nitratireducens]